MVDSLITTVRIWTSILKITIPYQEPSRVTTDHSPGMALDVFGEKFASVTYVFLYFILVLSRADSRPR